MPTEILESPRIALLREALENGHHEVLEVFWREVEAQGTLGAGTHICANVARWLKDCWRC